MNKVKIKSRKLKALYRKGIYLPVILMASTLFLAFATALATFAVSNIKIAELHNKKITATFLAEAGINYYLWHLAHDDGDFCDGNVCSGSPPYGPYTHNYLDDSGASLGNYSLYISPPQLGESTVSIRSVGKVNGRSPEKTVVAELGVPFFTKYTLLVNNSQLWIGPDEEINGTVHVNGSGVKMDGEVTGDISSSVSQYSTTWFGSTCETLYPDLEGDCPGIWTDDPSAVFGGSKLFPVTPVDMNQVNVDVANLYNMACNDAQGVCLDKSGQKGFHIVLDNDSFTVYKIKNYDSSSLEIKAKTSGPMGLDQILLGIYNYPSSGIIYSTEDIWLEGRVDDKRITIIADDNEGGSKRIVVPGNIKYTNYDGSDTIGLISQSNILVSRNAPTNMEIDAAMIAKDGVIQINSYCSPADTCNDDHKSHIKVYGSMAHKGGLNWTWDYGGGKWSGYQETETVIDLHNILNPPPQFPRTGSYTVLSWREE